jgi:hypothetical protein
MVPRRAAFRAWNEFSNKDWRNGAFRYVWTSMKSDAEGAKPGAVISFATEFAVLL